MLKEPVMSRYFWALSDIISGHSLPIHHRFLMVRYGQETKTCPESVSTKRIVPGLVCEKNRT
jgi:hypothetical protein